MSVGSVHDETQVAVGAVVATELLRLPVKSTAPALGSVCVPVVNVVAETMMCQPAPV